MNNLDFLGFAEAIGSLDPISYEYFHQLIDNRTIVLNTVIDENILESVVLPLMDFEKDNISDPITLIINTPGGSVMDGMLLCSIIDKYKKPLNIIVPSYACSMGTIILASGNNNPNVTKKCYPFTFALLHSGTTYVDGESHTVEDIVDFNKNMDNAIKKYIINNTNITEQEYDDHYRKQWYFTSEELVKYKFVDEIIGSEN